MSGVQSASKRTLYPTCREIARSQSQCKTGRSFRQTCSVPRLPGCNRLPRLSAAQPRWRRPCAAKTVDDSAFGAGPAGPLPVPNKETHLLGWVIAIHFPSFAHPASRRNCGSCVLLPVPVGDCSTTTGCCSSKYSRASPVRGCHQFQGARNRLGQEGTDVVSRWGAGSASR